MKLKLIRKLHILRAILKGLLSGLGLRFFIFIQEGLLGKKVAVINLMEHMGDIVACEPVIGWAQKNLGANYIIWCSKPAYQEIVENHPQIQKVWKLGCITEWIYAKKSLAKVQVIDLHIEGRVCFQCNIPLKKENNDKSITLENYYNFGPLLVAFCKESRIEVSPESQPHFYLSSQAETTSSGADRPYVVIHRRSNEVTRDWNELGWMAAVDLIFRKSNYDVVEIGAGYEPLPIQSPRYTSRIGSTTISESAALIKKCRIFLGVDSSMAHIANAFQRPALILIGKYRIFSQYIPYTGFYFQHREYIFSSSEPLQTIPPEPILERLEKLLHG